MLNVLPEPIKRLLAELYARGPSTVGIFRKSPNAKHCKELRQKLETSDGHSSIEQFQVNVIASVFKVGSLSNTSTLALRYNNEWPFQSLVKDVWSLGRKRFIPPVGTLIFEIYWSIPKKVSLIKLKCAQISPRRLCRHFADQWSGSTWQLFQCWALQFLMT